MKLAAILGAFVPWIVAVFAYLAVKGGAATHEALQVFPWLWMFMSPLWFAAGCLVSYRVGQWSKDKS